MKVLNDVLRKPGQACQVSRILRETHAIMLFLTLTRGVIKISRK